jgi:response regulator RpfG family c-di-GMP phosphodiesterase
VVRNSTPYTQPRPGRIRTKRGAVATILGLQAVVLAAGWVLTFMQVRHATATAVQDLVLAENIRVADWFAAELGDGIAGPVEYGSASWDRVQSRVEGLRLPGEGYACLLDGEGRILCHPDLRREPSMRGEIRGNMSLSLAEGGEHLMLGASPRAQTVAGRLRFFPGGTHFVATRYVPELGARLVVHQPESGLVAMSSRATLVVGIVAGSAAFSVVALTALATLWVMRRYDNELERINRGLGAEVERRTHENTRARDALIMGLAKLADCRDNETGLHLERISGYSGLLAQHLAGSVPEIDEGWIERLRVASSMHDIGKVGLPDEILLKPGRLTEDEFLRMQAHTTIGADTLLAIRSRFGDDELLDMSIRVALEHHEKWDGSGYPVRLSGEQIALPARIVALADVYDALTSRRVYKRAFGHAEARRIIVEGRGSHFDPTVVDAFLAVEPDFEGIRDRLHPGDPTDEPATASPSLAA